MIGVGEEYRYRIKIKKILDGDYYDIWIIDPDNLMCKNDKIYVPNNIVV